MEDLIEMLRRRPAVVWFIMLLTTSPMCIQYTMLIKDFYTIGLLEVSALQLTMCTWLFYMIGMMCLAFILFNKKLINPLKEVILQGEHANMTVGNTPTKGGT